MYAVIESGGKQYRVQEGETILVDRLLGKDGEKIESDKVLLLVDGKNVTIGTPYIEGTRVESEILGKEKLDKIRVSKFKAKVRYRRTIGYRHSVSRLKIIHIRSAKVALTKPKTTQKKTAKS